MTEIERVEPDEYFGDERQPFDRLDNEPKDHFELFKFYLSLGSRRSIKHVCETTGLNRSRVQPIATKQSWVSRAESYDMDTARAALKALEGDESQQEMRQRHIEIARSLVEKAGQAAELMDPHFISARDVPTWLDVAAKLERASKGLLDTKRLEVTGKGGDPIKIVNEMSAEERRELMKEARAELDRRLGKPEIEAIIEAEIVEDEVIEDE